MPRAASCSSYITFKAGVLPTLATIPVEPTIAAAAVAAVSAAATAAGCHTKNLLKLKSICF